MCLTYSATASGRYCYSLRCWLHFPAVASYQPTTTCLWLVTHTQVEVTVPSLNETAGKIHNLADAVAALNHVAEQGGGCVVAGDNQDTSPDPGTLPATFPTIIAATLCTMARLLPALVGSRSTVADPCEIIARVCNCGSCSHFGRCSHWAQIYNSQYTARIHQ